MSATNWKKRGVVRPYAPRNWLIPHIGALPNRSCDSRLTADLDAQTDAIRNKQEGAKLATPLRAGFDSNFLPGEVAVLGETADEDLEFGGVDSEKSVAEGDRHAAT